MFILYKVSHIIIKWVFVLINLLILYYKPFYLFIFLIIFSWEYLFFINFLYLIVINYKNYLKLEVETLKLDNLGFFNVWLEYSKLQAFNRIYVILSKPKIKILNIIKVFLIVLLGIPYKYLKLMHFFLFENKKGFEDGMRILYYQSFYKLKNCKIEIYEGQILINCYTMLKFIKSTNLKQLSTEKLFCYFNEIRNQTIKFSKYESTLEKMIEMKPTLITLKEGKKIHIAHYTYVEKNNTIHATSNIDFKTEESQRTDAAIYPLIKHGAKNHGTIISESVYKIEFFNKSIWIPEYLINAIKYNNLDLYDLSKDNFKYIYEKDIIYREIMNKYQIQASDQLLKELRASCYSIAFSDLTNKDITDFIEFIKNDNI